MECPDGVSLFIKDADFDSSDSQLIITLRNNGRFNLAGYFIHATNSSDQELPIIDLSGYLNEASPGRIHGNSVLFFELIGVESNLFTPGSEKSYFFDIPSSIGEPHLIRITPTRFQDVDERQRFVSCGDARVGQLVGGGVCIPDCTGRVCGPDPICGEICPPNDCGDGFFCDAVGKCIDLSCAPAPDPSLVGVCGTRVCGTATNGTCGEVNCLPGCDPSTETCNEITGQCEINCGNGLIDEGEECDDGNIVSGDGCSDCTIDIGWECDGEPSDCGEIGSYNCVDYCVDIDQGYSTGYCTLNTGQCTREGNTIMGQGLDVYCQPDFYCCCVP
jgi:cysteine-rich repeat protein